jgi:hypothetical protein
MIIEEKLGVVHSFEIPDDWRTDKRLDLGERQVSVFKDPNSDYILFCHLYRDVELSRGAAEKFQTALYAPFHELSEAEIQDLEPVIEGLSNKDVFKINLADTAYVNERRVIRIQGEWLEQRVSTMSCFIDNGGKGRRVQNLYFSAPTGHLDKYENLADQIFLSIKWQASD